MPKTIKDFVVNIDGTWVPFDQIFERLGCPPPVSTSYWWNDPNLRLCFEWGEVRINGFGKKWSFTSDKLPIRHEEKPVRYAAVEAIRELAVAK